MNKLTLSNATVRVDTQARLACTPAVQASFGPEQDGAHAVSARRLWETGTALVLGVPGAFCLPARSNLLTEYRERRETFRALGVDALWCVAVNDLYVMQAWMQAENLQDTFHAVADGSADFTRDMGLDVCLHDLGLGTRSGIYGMLVRHGSILHLAVEPPGQLFVARAPYMETVVRAYLA